MYRSIYQGVFFMLKKTKQVLAVALLANMALLNITAKNAPDVSSDVTKNVPVKKMSIEEFKTDALQLGQAACFFNTPGEDPYFNVIHTDVNETKVIKCGCYDEATNKNRKIKNAIDFENIVPLRFTLWGYGGNYKHDMKYDGCRNKSAVGTLLAETLLPKEEYKGKMFIDEYKQNIPMFWVLRNVEELRALRTYLLKNFIAENIVPTKKTLLVLKIKDDPEFKTVNEEDKAFLDTYFEMFPTTDQEIKKFFETNKQLMIERNYDMGGSKPKMVGETALQGAFREIEKYYKDFEFKKLAILVGGVLATKIIYDFISAEINAGKEKTIQKITGNENEKTFTGALLAYLWG